MTDTLSSLPVPKQRELAFIVDAIREGFAFAIERRTMPAVRGGRLLKIILFGSYARGDWVEDPIGRYFSDYDLLLVVDRDELSDVPEYWSGTEERMLDELTAGTRLRTPVSFIVHSLDDVNEKLKLGRYFFIDIVRDGVVLFEEQGFPFVEPKPLSSAEALSETEDYFEEWFGTAQQFMDGAAFHEERGHLNLAAFNYHQATERLYHCLFLIRTLYSPKTHNLNQLRRLAENLDPRLKAIWPRYAKDERRAYELLREAYVKARYSRHYQISKEQLSWLSQRIELLQSVVQEIFGERRSELTNIV